VRTTLETNNCEVEDAARPLFSQVTDDTIGSKYKPRFVCGLDFKNQTNEISSDRRVNSGPYDDTSQRSMKTRPNVVAKGKLIISQSHQNITDCNC
jgi:hypothetical protein